MDRQGDGIFPSLRSLRLPSGTEATASLTADFFPSAIPLQGKNNATQGTSRPLALRQKPFLDKSDNKITEKSLEYQKKVCENKYL
jgi:hypothetical protein